MNAVKSVSLDFIVLSFCIQRSNILAKRMFITVCLWLQLLHRYLSNHSVLLANRPSMAGNGTCDKKHRKGGTEATGHLVSFRAETDSKIGMLPQL